MTDYSEKAVRKLIKPRYGVRYIVPPEFGGETAGNRVGFAFFNSPSDACTFRDVAQAEVTEAAETGPKFEAYNIHTGELLS